MIFALSACASDAGSRPGLVASPSSELVDKQTVMVSVRDFPPNTTIELFECASSATANAQGCGSALDTHQTLTTDASGGGQRPYVLSAQAGAGPLGAAPIEACTTQCVLVASDATTFAVASVSFASP